MVNGASTPDAIGLAGLRSGFKPMILRVLVPEIAVPPDLTNPGWDVVSVSRGAPFISKV